MIRRLRLAALAALAALAFTACTDNDAKKSDVVNAMLDAGLDADQAECVGDGIDQEFSDDQDLYNDVAAATDSGEFPGDTEQIVDDILADCLGEPPDDGGDGGG